MEGCLTTARRMSNQAIRMWFSLRSLPFRHRDCDCNTFHCHCKCIKIETYPFCLASAPHDSCSQQNDYSLRERRRNRESKTGGDKIR